jgi:hypothetical protein
MVRSSCFSFPELATTEFLEPQPVTMADLPSNLSGASFQVSGRQIGLFGFHEFCIQTGSEVIYVHRMA